MYRPDLMDLHSHRNFPELLQAHRKCVAVDFSSATDDQNMKSGGDFIKYLS
jgi:hypothetical protein